MLDLFHDKQLDRIEQYLETIITIITNISRKENNMSIVLDNLIAQVTALTTVNDSVVALLSDLKVKLDVAIANNDMAAVSEITAALSAQTQRLADAVVANTPTV
jgi:hypothetical protein